MKLEFEFSLITIHLNSIEFITYLIYIMYIYKHVHSSHSIINE